MWKHDSDWSIDASGDFGIDAEQLHFYCSVLGSQGMLLICFNMLMWKTFADIAYVPAVGF